MENFYTFILGRRSVRKYRDQPVSREIIERIIHAGIWAPSAHNAQPWRFAIIKSPAMKRKLAEAMAAVYQRDLVRDEYSSHVVETIVAASIERFTKAPALILVGLTMDPMETYQDSARQQVEYVMAVQSVAAAIQNILLSIHAEGLGACWCCAPLFCPDAVRATLELPVTFEPQALITIGYPGETPQHPERQPPHKILRYEQ